MSPLARWGLLALAGSAITACDHLHVLGGVLWYPHVAFWGQAWWVPLLFAGAAVVLIAGARQLAAWLADPAERPPAPREVAGDAIAFVCAYAFTAFAASSPNLVAWVLVGFWLARVVHGRPAWQIGLSVATAIGGALFEGALSATGAFYYNEPDFVGVPRWLPALYLHVALLTGPLSLHFRAPRLAPTAAAPAR